MLFCQLGRARFSQKITNGLRNGYLPCFAHITAGKRHIVKIAHAVRFESGAAVAG